MKSFVAENSFWELFPQAAIGVVVVKGMKPAAQIPRRTWMLSPRCSTAPTSMRSAT
ncbi:MAG: hypothetical protein ACLS3M_04280 [Collinsella sp.]